MSNDLKISKISSKRKKSIYSKIKDTKNQIFNISYLEEQIPLIKSLDELDINKILNITKNFEQCRFINSNFCWVSEYENKQRYFTKRYVTYAFDVLDLLSLYFNCSYRKVFNYLIQDFGYKGDIDRVNEIEEYLLNYNSFESLLNEDDIFYKHIYDKKDIYLKINEFAKENNLSYIKYKDKPIFFVSGIHLKNKYDLDYSKSTINQMINLYLAIGLIEKVPEEYLKTPLFYKYKKEKVSKNSISFYIINSLEDNKEEILKKLRIIDNLDLKYYNLNKSILLKLNEKYDFKTHYPETIGGGNYSKKSLENLSNIEVIEYLFEYYLEEYRVVAKEWLLKDLEQSNKDVSDSFFNKIWTSLINSKEGKTVKPNNKMKTLYSLETNKDVFIKRKG